VGAHTTLNHVSNDKFAVAVRPEVDPNLRAPAVKSVNT
jgi:hypothetical protein